MQARVAVDRRGLVVVVEDAVPVVDGIATITIADDPIPALPRAAGPGTTRLVFAGAFLLVSGIGVALLRRRPARVPNRG